jgi:hypothetical protein
VSDEKIPVHPVQRTSEYKYREEGQAAPQVVTLRAYEVYKEVYGAQEKLITGGCRGGFSVGELVSFLYARIFTKDELELRVDEAFKGMRL